MMSLSVCLCPQAADWVEDELSLLSRLMVKFPGGSPGRWEKIAQELGRSVTDVSMFEKLRFISQPESVSSLTEPGYTTGTGPTGCTASNRSVSPPDPTGILYFGLFKKGI